MITYHGYWVKESIGLDFVLYVLEMTRFFLFLIFYCSLEMDCWVGVSFYLLTDSLIEKLVWLLLIMFQVFMLAVG